jgi:putative transposase
MIDCLFEQETKPVIRSDNVSYGFEEACERFDVLHERIPPKTSNMNAHIESFHGILQDDYLARYDFETYSEAYEAVTSFMRFYNERRIHSSIGDLAPSQFYEKKKMEPLAIKEVRV